MDGGAEETADHDRRESRPRTEPEGLEDQPGAGRRETCPRRRGPA